MRRRLYGARWIAAAGLLLAAAIVVEERRLSRADAPPADLLRLVPPTHRYVGELDTSFLTLSLKPVARADGLLTLRLAPRMAFTQAGAGLHLTTPQGFAALSESDPDARYERPKPKDVYRVVMLGGSTVFGIGARLPSESLPSRVLTELTRANPRRKLELINAGVPGAASSREVLYLETELLGYEPDLVIVYDGLNDVWTNHATLSRKDAAGPAALSHFQTDDVNALLRAAVDTRGSARLLRDNLAGDVDRFLSRSALYRRFKRRESPPPAPQPAENLSELHPGAVRMHALNHARLVESAKRNGFKVALFLQPVMGVDGKPLSPSENELLARFNRYNRTRGKRAAFYAGAEESMRARARAHAGDPAVCVASLTGSFTDVRDTVYTDPVHLNALGNRIVAERIARHLRRCRFL